MRSEKAGSGSIAARRIFVRDKREPRVVSRNAVDAMKMRRMLSSIAVVCACSSERVDAPPAVPANWASLNQPQPVVVRAPTAKERATAEAYVKALANPPFANIAPLFDDLAHVAFGRKDARGRDRVVGIHEQLFGAFDQRKVEVTRIWRTDETQIVEWSMSGVHAREWMGVPATQKQVQIRGIALLWTKDDGIITDVHVYFNVAAIKAELGVGPKDLQERAATLQLPVATAPPIEKQDDAVEKHDKQTVRDSLDAFEQGKEADYLNAFTNDVIIETLTAPPSHGKDDLRAYYRTSWRTIGQLDTTIANLWGIGSFAIVEYTISGDVVGAAMPTSIRHYLLDVIEMREEKIAHVWRYDGADLPTPTL